MGLKQASLRALAAFGALNVAIIFTPTTPYGLLFVILVAAALLLLDFRDGVLLVVSSFVLVLVLEAAVRFSGANIITPYYRTHEVLAEETRYRANQHLEMTERHGDLLAIDPNLDMSLGEPREVVFHTDSRGFRNDDDAFDGQVLIVGDSLVVGTANTQADTLTAQLNGNHGVSAYNMGYPAGPFQYANTVAAARQEFGDEACIVVAMFEGNDFQLIDPTELAARTAVPRAGQEFVKAYFAAIKAPFEISKVVYGLQTRAIEALRSLSPRDPGDAVPVNAGITFIGLVGGKPMIFLSGYAHVVLREDYEDFDYIRDQFERATPDLFVFVPDKYRVYAPLLDADPVDMLPDAQLTHLAQVAGDLGVPLLDLTGPLQHRSRELLSQGRVTYWRDDTHWNRAGIAVAAEALARALPAHPKPACRAATTGEPSGAWRFAAGA